MRWLHKTNIKGGLPKKGGLYVIYVLTNVFMISLCKTSVATIKSWSSVPSLQSQSLTFSPNSSLSIPAPFSRKSSIASCLSLRSQSFSWKSLVATPQSQAFSPKLSFSTLQCQHVCFNFLLATTQPQPFSHKQLEAFSGNTSVLNLQFQGFGCNPSVATPRFQFEAFSCNHLVTTLQLQCVCPCSHSH